MKKITSKPMKTLTTTKTITNTHLVIATLILMAVGWIAFAILPAYRGATLLTGNDLTEVTSLGGTDCAQYVNEATCAANNNCLWKTALLKGAKVAGGTLSVGADRCVLNIGAMTYQGFNLTTVAEAATCNSTPINAYATNTISATTVGGNSISLSSACMGTNALRQYSCLKQIPESYIQQNATGLLQQLYNSSQHGNFAGIFDYSCPSGCTAGKCIQPGTEVLDYTPRTTGVVANGKNVYYVSVTGNNNNAGTQTAPLENLNYAVTIAVPPAIIYVLPGEYAYKKAATDYYVSLKDNVDMVCTLKQQCVLYGPIYPASNSTIDGFKLMPLVGENVLTSTNEIAAGISRYGSPKSGNILFPIKEDNYLVTLNKVVIKNNYIYDNQIRVLNSTNVLIDNNIVKIDRFESQNWGVQLIENNSQVKITNNNLTSGAYLDKQKPSDRPSRPAGILIQKSNDVEATNNTIAVRPDINGKTIGYGIIIGDDPQLVGYTTPSVNVVLSNNQISGKFIAPLKDFRTAYCGNAICETDEILNNNFNFEYSCPQDCCGNKKCDAGEINRFQAEKGYKGYVCDADCPVQ